MCSDTQTTARALSRQRQPGPKLTHSRRSQELDVATLATALAAAALAAALAAASFTAAVAAAAIAAAVAAAAVAAALATATLTTATVAAAAAAVTIPIVVVRRQTAARENENVSVSRITRRCGASVVCGLKLDDQPSRVLCLCGESHVSGE